MKNTFTDYLNLGLLILSFYIAVKVPFELFLFSYAFLGPLHYLTEINWLNDKNYFIKANKKWVFFYCGVALLIALYPVLLFFGFDEVLKLKYVGVFNNVLLLAGFLFAISLVFFSKKNQLAMSLVISIIIALLFYFFVPDVLIYTGIFLPTLIHVYIFTLLFMIYGAVKTKTNLGVINIVLLLVIPCIIVAIDVFPKEYVPSEFVRGTYIDTNLTRLNISVAKFFSTIDVNTKFYLISELGVKIQIFISFAYTYHYLNWFSKTSIIGWKNSITPKKLKYILSFWASAIVIYLYDYRTGLIALLFLSFLHVFLEFPLNITTVKSLFSFKKSIKTTKKG